MYASIRRYVIGTGSMDALVHRIDEEFAPAISQEPGFISYVAVDTGDRTLETISVFADEASARRSDELAAEYVSAELGDFQMRRTAVAGGEVLVNRAEPAALDDIHRWRSGQVRGRVATEAHGEAPVLVVGATGRTGRLIVDRLIAHHLPVRALVRDRAKGRALLPDAVKQFVGDVRRAETLAASMASVKSMIVAAAGGGEPDNSPEIVDYLGTISLLKQALAAGVERVVFVSSIYVSRPEHYQDVESSSLGWKARAEELIRDSGLSYCIVRAGWLTDRPGGEPLALSQGDVAEGRLSRADLADVCTKALLLDDAFGKTFEVVAARDGGSTVIEPALAALQPDRGGAGRMGARA